MSMFKEPIAGFFEGGERGNGPCLIMGFVGYLALILRDDGKFQLAEIDSVTPDIRYDWRNHQWIEVRDIGQETPDDGGTQLSGSVPNTDRVSDSDPIDTEGGPSTGDPGNVDTREEGAPGDAKQPWVS